MKKYIAGSRGLNSEIFHIENLTNLYRLKHINPPGEETHLIDIVDTGQDVQITFIKEGIVIGLSYKEYSSLFVLMSVISEIGNKEIKQEVKLFAHLTPVTTCRS